MSSRSAETLMIKAAPIIVATALVLCLGSAHAASVPFDGSWQEQRFSLFSSNDYVFTGDALAVRSDGTASLVWTELPPTYWQAREASWRWQVQEGVPPTDLTVKGGDDRDLALYFLFLPERLAESVRGRDLTDLLDEPEVRVLVYVWGGDHPQNAILPTPYLGGRGRMIVKQAAATGLASEAVDLAADHSAAFGEPAQSLVGLAVSADSDDTNSRIIAQIEKLRLLH